MDDAEPIDRLRESVNKAIDDMVQERDSFKRRMEITQGTLLNVQSKLIRTSQENDSLKNELDAVKRQLKEQDNLYV